MRRIYAFAACVLVLGCASGDDPSRGRDVGHTSEAILSTDAIARGQQWVDVNMPYCGGVNNGPDAICGGTCVRTGAAASAAWDKYRTDCSGFISWSWGLPGPGLVTGDFAALKVTKAITLDELLPGDALVTHDAATGEGHIFMFDGWVSGKTKLHMMEESTCKAPNNHALSVDIGVTVVDTGHLKKSGDARVYTAIRFDKMTFPTAGAGGSGGAGGSASAGTGGTGTAGGAGKASAGAAGSAGASTGAGGTSGIGGSSSGSAGAPSGAAGQAQAAGSAGMTTAGAAGSGATGGQASSGAAGQTSSAGAGGQKAGATPSLDSAVPGEGEKGGCSITEAPRENGSAMGIVMMALAAIAGRRRRR